MWKLAIIMFIIVGPTLAGIGALVPLTIYGVGDFSAFLLVGCAAAGALVAMPVSYFVAARIGSMMGPNTSAQH
ncbi:hypothetical protein [Labrenzia sp. DG1229]|uniref:hypothetical protein n=1 Tax=Labrenzia sp. DG1229 TaxID=681847 RepID=UPI00048C17E9|nr:hypothetical protein [Labrenzia sp. DG1229]